MNVLLIIICAVILSMAIYGYKKGFVKMLVPLVSAFLSLIVLLMLKDWLFAILFQWAIFQGEHVLTRVVLIWLIFVLGTLAFKWLIKILHILTKLPLVCGLNKLLGLMVGLIEGFLLVWFFLYIVQIRQGELFGFYIETLIEQNGFLNFLYLNNLIEYLMNTLFGGWIR